MRGSVALLLILVLLSPTPLAAGSAGAADLRMSTPVVVRAAAVATQPDGSLVGSVSTMSITTAQNGTGHVFIDTLPLAQVDMQGSARLAVKVAGSVTGLDISQRDFFFVIRSGSQVIGGPSAGGVLTVGTIAALKGWAIDPRVMMTGTINPDGTIGPVGGVPEKAQAAALAGVSLFLFPEGQEQATAGARNAPIDLVAYCRDQLRIECRSILTVEDAVRAFTGHEFPSPSPAANATSPSKYAGIMREPSRLLLESANSSFANATTALADLNASAPSSVRTTLQQHLATAATGLDDASAAFNDSRYYTTASRTFQSAIEARFIADVVALYARDPTGRQALVSELFDKAAADSSAAVNASAATPPTTLGVLQAVGAAQTRATEAETLARDARSQMENATGLSGALGALYTRAYAVERAGTSTWWLSLAPTLASGGPVAQEGLRSAASDAIQEATDQVTYAGILLAESGAPSGTLGQAQSQLDASQHDLQRGLLAGSLYEALEASVRASVGLELLGYEAGVPQSKLDRAAAQASDAVNASRAAGIEPVLSSSYAEFATSLTSASDEIVFYQLARIVAGLPSSLVASSHADAPRASRFVGDSTWPNASSPGPSATSGARAAAAPASAPWLDGTNAFFFVAGALVASTLLILWPRRDPTHGVVHTPDASQATPIAPPLPTEPLSPIEPPSSPGQSAAQSHADISRPSAPPHVEPQPAVPPPQDEAN